METNIRSMLQWISAFRVAQTQFPSRALMNLNTQAELEACRQDFTLNRPALAAVI